MEWPERAGWVKWGRGHSEWANVVVFCCSRRCRCCCCCCAYQCVMENVPLVLMRRQGRAGKEASRSTQLQPEQEPEPRSRQFGRRKVLPCAASTSPRQPFAHKPLAYLALTYANCIGGFGLRFRFRFGFCMQIIGRGLCSMLQFVVTGRSSDWATEAED